MNCRISFCACLNAGTAVPIEISLLKKVVIISYSDNGPGIPSVFRKNRDEIFLPFTTSKRDRLGNTIGTGLGMYLVKAVIDDNSGNVELMNSKVGFKLKIKLPIINK